ncbi:MAG: hypothetical protein IRY99_08565, partial [Isosphaeraceae bacterium]|nr:hypothetical protein [Isosphaeraceae bacterium]
MRSFGFSLPVALAGIVGFFSLSGPSLAGEGDPPKNAAAEVPSVDLMEGMRQGLLDVEARGIGDGRMTVKVTNRAGRPLRVLLPPTLVAQGTVGQFGGLGGMGMGGMGGMGMMGGMGGMGMMGGMGGMGMG